jgi:hypothetical protein
MCGNLRVVIEAILCVGPPVFETPRWCKRQPTEASNGGKAGSCVRFRTEVEQRGIALVFPHSNVNGGTDSKVWKRDLRRLLTISVVGTGPMLTKAHTNQVPQRHATVLGAGSTCLQPPECGACDRHLGG